MLFKINEFGKLTPSPCQIEVFHCQIFLVLALLRGKEF
jgi:hypothetical protein